jgi:hypothetical protein
MGLGQELHGPANVLFLPLSIHRVAGAVQLMAVQNEPCLADIR